MLAEAWEPELLKEDLFDMAYNWEGHHTKNKIAQGKNSLKDWDKFMTENQSKYSPDDILMNFVDNHDENSWNGTVKGRLGKAEEAMTALSYVMPGMPLIYSGNEYGLNHSLKFFEKDSIPKTKGKDWELRAKLGKLKAENPALNGGKNKANYTRIQTTDDANILAFVREKNGNKVVYIANFSNNTVEAEILYEGKFTNYMKQNTVTLSKNQKTQIKPWEYFILVN
jgi:glycosidase